MSKAKRDGATVETTLPNTPSMHSLDIQPLMSANANGFKAMAQAQEHMLRRVANFNKEIFKFVDRRLEHDRKTVKEIASCDSPQDAYTVYGKFFEAAAKHYSDEMEALASLYATQTQEILEDAQHQMKDVAVSGDKNAGNA